MSTLFIYLLLFYVIVATVTYSIAKDNYETYRDRTSAIVALLSPVWPVLVLGVLLYFVGDTIFRFFEDLSRFGCKKYYALLKGMVKTAFGK
jgi:hypothetical protein